MSDAVKRVSAEISGSEISGSRDFQADSALASGRASGNQLGRPRFARHGGRCARSLRAVRLGRLLSPAGRARQVGNQIRWPTRAVGRAGLTGWTP